ncbi:biotin/lipoyl-binding protein [Flavobacterium sp.]|uniref:HlyD family secretion protein n=1 Tax=Flavobacterium sp. TaxID=239 RepID=UPI00261F138A|nr:biotin/lipoyl-binding protein [Flavobacterium sp.]MDD2987244.1 HlyD family efflux transporter periplasmic adaptor subunit [Flavobacterium sp.]
MKKIYLLLVVVISAVGCGKPKTEVIQGKIEREQIGIVSKIPGKIIEIRIQEGDFVRKGDTLAILDIPEVDAKKSQAEGSVQSAKAQYDMTLKGATDNQLKQLEAKQKALKEQYELAQKSINRLSNMLKDSLVSQQMYDEAFAKYQGAQSQYLAVQAEISDVKYGARIEQQKMALGQQERALGALQEVSVADSERYIIAPQDMTVESITLKAGELALPGYTLISGTISESTYFRFTIPESRLSKVQKGQEVTVNIVYNKSQVKGKITSVKALGAYANIATAYPDYEIQESLFEIKISPIDVEQAKDLFTKTTVTLELLK